MRRSSTGRSGSGGLSKRSVYIHFDNKGTPAVAILEQRHGRWIADIARRLADASPGELRIPRLLPAILSLRQETPDAWVISRLTRSLADVDFTCNIAAAVTLRWIELVADLGCGRRRDTRLREKIGLRVRTR